MKNKPFRCRVLAASELDALEGEWAMLGDASVRERARSASFVLLKLYGAKALSAPVEAFLKSYPTGSFVWDLHDDVALLGGPRILIEELCARLNSAGHAAGREITAAVDNHARADYVLRLPGGTLALSGRPKVMGVLNVTPDSFSDGGQHATTDAAIAHGLRMAEEGADLIDVGGESTRPGAQAVPADEEIRRVAPVIEELSRRIRVPMSIDTSKSGVARRALDSGAGIVNDVTALRGDAGLAPLLAERGVPVILMHMQGEPRTMQEAPHYDDLMGEVAALLLAQIDVACAAGIARDQIVVDPGIGFGKLLEHNLEILRRLPELRSLGCPILVGASRKSTIGQITGRPADQRLCGSLAAAAAAAMNGAHIVRVHDVAETIEVLKVCESIRKGKPVCR